MRNDPIVEEVRKVRKEHAARFNYDLRAIAADLQRQEKKARRKFMRLSPKRPVVFPKHALPKSVKQS